MDCHRYTDKITGCLLTVTTRLMQNELTKTINDLGWELSFEQLQTLFILWGDGEVSQNDLGEKSGKDKTNISRIIHSLVLKGLVYRMPLPTDRRNNIISLSEEGIKAKNPIQQQAYHFLDTIVEGVSEEELRITHKTLERMLNNLMSLKEGK